MFAEDFIVQTKTFPFPNTIFMLVFENQTEHFTQSLPEHSEI